MVYFADATALLVKPEAAAIALMVVVAETTIGPFEPTQQGGLLKIVEAVVGVDPLVVK